jgi:hypothetical protein
MFCECRNIICLKHPLDGHLREKEIQVDQKKHGEKTKKILTNRRLKCETAKQKAKDRQMWRPLITSKPMSWALVVIERKHNENYFRGMNRLQNKT